MGIGVKKLFGNGSLPPEVVGELRTILLQMRHERTAFEALATQVHETLGGAELIAAPVEQMRESVETLRASLDAVEAAIPPVRGFEARMAGLEGRLDEAGAATGTLREALARAEADAGTTAAETLAARTDLDAVRQHLGDIGAVKDAVGDFVAMRDELTMVRQELTALRSQQEALAAENRTARSQLGQTVDQFATMQADVAEAAQRVRSLRETIDPVADLVRGVPEVRADLQRLQALRDFVAPRLVTMDEQRVLVERVAERGDRLEIVLQRLESELQRHADYHLAMTELRERVTALAGEHRSLEEGCERIRAAQLELCAQDGTLRADVERVRGQLTTELERAARRFALERDGLDAVSERVEAMRAALVGAEQRFQGLDDASLLVDEVRTDSGHLRELVAEIERDMSALAQQGARVRELEGRLEPLEETAAGLAARLDAVREPSEAAITRAEARLSELTVQVDVLEGRADHLEGTAATVRALGHELDRQRLTVEGALAELRRATELKHDADAVLERLSERAAELTGALSVVEVRVTTTRAIAETLDGRAAELVVAGAAMDRFEDRLRAWKAMEDRLGRAMAQATERHAVVQALRADLHRMFGMVEDTAAEVRATLAVRGELEAGRALIEDVAPQVREVRAEAERIAERREALAGHDALLARVETLLSELRAGLTTLESQKTFLDQVVTTAGVLRFQTRQAESLIDALDEVWKRART